MKCRRIHLYIAVFLFYIFYFMIVKNIDLTLTILYVNYMLIFIFSIFRYKVSRLVMLRYVTVRQMLSVYIKEIFLDSVYFIVFIFLLRSLFIVLGDIEIILSANVLYQYILIFINIIGISMLVVVERIARTKYMITILLLIINIAFTIFGFDFLAILSYPSLINNSLFSIIFLISIYSVIIYELITVWEWYHEK